MIFKNCFANACKDHSLCAKDILDKNKVTGKKQYTNLFYLKKFKMLWSVIKEMKIPELKRPTWFLDHWDDIKITLWM